MKKKQPPKKPLDKIQPEWKFPLWYVGLMLLLLWVWQDTFSRFTVQTIPYSEFKRYLARGEVTECSVRETEITGHIVPKGPLPATPNEGSKVTNEGGGNSDLASK